MTKETELYGPVKAFLEGQGYEVKGEIGACDVVGVRDGDEPVIVELKTSFSLSLFHQGVARQSIVDDVYVAVPRKTGKLFLKAIKDNTALCRRLGLGLITVRLSDGLVQVHQDPAAYAPRKSKPRKGRLLKEFARRVGDPNEGGQTRVGLITAYRQDALKCARYLATVGACKGSQVAKAAEVPTATRIMADDHYGWFERVKIGHYALTPKGENALGEFEGILEA
ncbi:DUF2161 domain-containing phosphodiesterase [Litoreibacter janthinus]|uniref:Uncharacterized protein n=1 Tax=Litoreibacter janthinus TaxID=670154 RepID=A0A1I6HUV7_9RHOB|nr:DUF2161 family putative PD-(D/E)XK-type phosphodiesterase [Litoreibacter janthinus]SFR58229.1 hypothetical protein SAMN04488002_3470 [Litoreibacter janthinus]